MVANPQVIQRPIITASDGVAVVARDAETLGAVVEKERR
jgi:arsenate reductase-like glutaredoxin family protein